MPGDGTPHVLDAASLILLRDRPHGAPELLMLERAGTLRFAGGAWVFPGGRVDAGDVALAAVLADAPEDAACRIAAIRETIEEAGLAAAIAPAPDPDWVATARAALTGGAAIGAVLGGHALALDALVPFARWRPDHLPRVFDTRFYLARALPEATARADGGECVAAAWAGAADILARADRGQARLLYPTRRMLERLARHASFAAAVADAAAHPPRVVTPWAESRAGVAHLCIPDDLGYPVTAERLDHARRA